MIAHIELLLKEMEQEAATTRKMLAIVPDDKYDWKPHPKSMSLRELAIHVAEITGWVHLVLTTDYLDFAETPYELAPVFENKALMELFEKSYSSGKEALSNATEDDLLKMWTMRSGEQIFSHETKAESIRHCFCQEVHHRAQLGVYLRLLNIPIPGSYGPSADEMEAMMAAQAS